MDLDETQEFGNQSLGKSQKKGQNMTLQQAIDLGEYYLDVLSTFPEFLKLSHHAQFQMVRQALENRRHQLLMQWAETSNMLDFSKKPELKEALVNIKKQLDKVEEDREKIYLDFSKMS